MQAVLFIPSGLAIYIAIYILRALSSLRGLRGAPEVPPLCRETLVSRTANVERNRGPKWVELGMELWCMWIFQNLIQIRF